MFSQDRDSLRRYLTAAWAKASAAEPLEPLEQQIAGLVREHPEYQALLAEPATAIGREFVPEAGQTNPFLHLGLHLALLEQVATDRPAGIRDLYQALMRRSGDAHAVEHMAMECLAQALWEAQCGQRPPDEAAYVECLTHLARG
jgi:hypothetical protein